MVVVNTGVVKLAEFVRIDVPKLTTSNQSIVLPVGAIADISTVPAPQRLLGTAVDNPGMALMVAVTAVLVVDTQPVAVFLLST